MKIYFSASLLYKNERQKIYEEITKVIENTGNTIIGFDVLTTTAEEVIERSDDTRIESYKKFLKWISTCDQMVVEASFPSTLHIGHEISIALEKGKPVIALYQKGSKPFFLSGIQSDKLTMIEYVTTDDLSKSLTKTLKDNLDVVDTRFNFYISPEIGRYLDWISQHKKLPRAVFLRSLLEKSMKSEKDFEN